MKTILILLILAIVLLLIMGFIIILCNITAELEIPTKRCPNCNTEMKVVSSNIYIGKICYECPKCGKQMSYHYEEDELIKKTHK